MARNRKVRVRSANTSMIAPDVRMEAMNM